MPFDPRALVRQLRPLVDPVPGEKRRLLAARWSELAPDLRVPHQGFGRQTAGCGATIGIQPRCDFDCLGCYLGAEANRIPRLAHRRALAQLGELRRWLGPKGNLQLTDGEVTLLPEPELVALVREARRLGLVPMVMSHGDTFRRRPGLLPRLVEEGGLTEVSIHVDSLQRGRRGGFAPGDEAALDPLREEMAGLVRETRRRTGRPLRAAMTATVAEGNLDGVGGIVTSALSNRDAFGLVSFQPLARVGRTRAGLAGVSPAELWRRIGDALAPHGHRPAAVAPLALGHPDCTRVEPMLAYRRRGEALRLVPIVRTDAASDRDFVARYLDAGLGGLAFRDDRPLERLSRTLGALARAPSFWLDDARAWIGERLAELGTSPAGLLADLARGRVELGSFQVVSHHFMDETEVATPRGRERLAACVFRVPVDGEMLPMCRVNAAGVRREVYSRQAAESAVAGGSSERASPASRSLVALGRGQGR